MTVAILDYNAATVDILDFIPNFKNTKTGGITEKVERYLTEELQYNLDEISYMIKDEGSIPVNYLGREDFG